MRIPRLLTAVPIGLAAVHADPLSPRDNLESMESLLARRHNDGGWERAQDIKSSGGSCLVAALQAAKRIGRTVEDRKNDWKTVFPG